MFCQADLSQFFLGNSGPLKRQNEQRTQFLEITKCPNTPRQFFEGMETKPSMVS